jgi:hypothetical protein
MAKLALCMGINDYPNTEMDLAGCVNDAQDWAAELARRGFEVAPLLLNERATKQAMQHAMADVIKRAVAGDTVAITFSGHGTYVFNTDVDEAEPDGYDEALCPYDVATTGEPLTDDEIHALLAQRAPGVRLLLIADSCHSGTVSRAARSPQAGAPRKRFLPMAHWLKPAQRSRAEALQATLGEAHSGGSVLAPPPDDANALDDVLMSGCQEGADNFSYDAVLAGRPVGAFTFHALKALRELPPGATYADWHRAITPEYLPSINYPQTPQLVAAGNAAQRAVLD